MPALSLTSVIPDQRRQPPKPQTCHTRRTELRGATRPPSRLVLAAESAAHGVGTCVNRPHVYFQIRALLAAVLLAQF